MHCEVWISRAIISILYYFICAAFSLGLLFKVVLAIVSSFALFLICIAASIHFSFNAVFRYIIWLDKRLVKLDHNTFMKHISVDVKCGLIWNEAQADSQYICIENTLFGLFITYVKRSAREFSIMNKTVFFFILFDFDFRLRGNATRIESDELHMEDMRNAHNGQLEGQ